MANARGWLGSQLHDWAKLLKNSYFTFDRRTLGLTRILLGFFLIMDLFRRTADWDDMFADTGVLPNWVVLNRPQASGFSLVAGFTTPGELWALWAVILFTYLCVLVGYHTKIAQVASLIFVTSMNGRVLLIENGGYVVHNLLLLWTCFMPLGDRFSVDGFLESMRRRRETTAEELNDRSDVIAPYRLTPFVSLVGLVLCVQIAAIYYFNIVHKTGPDWKRFFTAVHYVMYVDRMVNPIIGATREYIPPFVYRAMTFAVVLSEAALGFCMLLPQVDLWGLDVKKWLRRLALVLMNFLHIGFGSTFVLGPFAWALCVMSTLLFSTEDWDTSVRAMIREHRRRTVLFDPKSGAALWFCRVVVRFDRFGLIGFEAATSPEELRPGIAVERPNGELVTGAAAIADIVAAVPVGAAFAWMLKYPPLSGLLDAALRAARGRASRFLGLGTSLAEPIDVPPLRYRFRKIGKALSEVACAIMLIGAVNQALTELWVTKKWWADWIKSQNENHGFAAVAFDGYAWAYEKVTGEKGSRLESQPPETRLLTHKLRFLQGWFMFSPNPVKDDGTIIVDAITVDGRHVDPFWGKPPNFDLTNAKSFGYNQIWSDYFNRIQTNGNRAYRDAVVDYMRRLPERTGNPNDALVSGEMYWVHDMNPRFGTTKSYGYGKNLLFTFGKEGGAKNVEQKK